MAAPRYCQWCGFFMEADPDHECAIAPASPAPVISLLERKEASAPPPAPTPEWTRAEELVATFLEEIRSGVVKPKHLMVLFVEADSKGDLRPQSWLCNVSAPLAIALCAYETQHIIGDWKG